MCVKVDGKYDFLCADYREELQEICGMLYLTTNSQSESLDYAVSKFFDYAFGTCTRSTVLLHFFLNRYAAAPQELRTDWSKFTTDYFISRSTLVSVFLLIDASIPAKKIDLEYASWLGQNQVSSSTINKEIEKN
ncbi:hypothetical protein DITRI_Ditri10aG0120000 [Diplodiscus trichospermus]